MHLVEILELVMKSSWKADRLILLMDYGKMEGFKGTRKTTDKVGSEGVFRLCVRKMQWRTGLHWVFPATLGHNMLA